MFRDYLNCPPDLRAALFTRLARERRQLTIWGVVLTTLTVGLGGLIFFLFTRLGESAQVSGFAQYFSLIFSDRSAILSDGRELIWSLLESAPMFDLIALGLAATVTVWLATRVIFYQQLRQTKF